MKKYIPVLFLAVFVLTGCHVISPNSEISSKQAEPKRVEGVATVHGMLVDAQNNPVPGKAVHFAQVFRSSDSAAFVYDAGNSPSVISGDDGSFNIINLNGGEYVLVIGDPMTNYNIISQENGEPKVIEVQGGENVEVGPLTVALP